jgi:hypothetical protein
VNDDALPPMTATTTTMKRIMHPTASSRDGEKSLKRSKDKTNVWGILC